MRNNTYPKTAPLMCWDLFMDSHFRRLMQMESLQEVKSFAQQKQWRIDWDLEQLIVGDRRVVLVTDTAQVIQFATSNLVTMNGYSPEEVVGRQPKMFQGADTEPEVKQQIREAIVRRIPFKGNILNYRKDGTPYRCFVEEYPVWNQCGELVHFVAFEKIA